MQKRLTESAALGGFERTVSVSDFFLNKILLSFIVFIGFCKNRIDLANGFVSFRISGTEIRAEGGFVVKLAVDVYVRDFLRNDVPKIEECEKCGRNKDNSKDDIEHEYIREITNEEENA